MPVIPKKTKSKINPFVDVKVLKNKDLFERLGPRVPKMPKTGGQAIFSLRKTDANSLGAEIAELDLTNEMAQQSATVEQPEQSTESTSTEETVTE